MSGPAPGRDDGDGWSTTFLSRLVHELRTPLASLQIAAGMLHDDPRVPPGLGSTTEGLVTAVADLEELLDQVGELNRIRAGRTRPAAAPVEVERLFAGVAAATAEAVAATGSALAMAPGPPGAGAPPASDARLLERALACLVRSALAGGARRVELAVAADPGGFAFAVRDDGPAPAPQEREGLLDPFGPAPRARRRHGGTGLGLPLADAIARLLGGELVIASAAGATTLAVRLPRG